MGRRRIVGQVLSIRIVSRELGQAPNSAILRAIFEFTLANGQTIVNTEDFGPSGIMDENLELLLKDFKRIAGLEGD